MGATARVTEAADRLVSLVASFGVAVAVMRAATMRKNPPGTLTR